jgi:Ca2+-binding RTX toxin-like protein
MRATTRLAFLLLAVVAVLLCSGSVASADVIVRVAYHQPGEALVLLEGDKDDDRVQIYSGADPDAISVRAPVGVVAESGCVTATPHIAHCRVDDTSGGETYSMQGAAGEDRLEISDSYESLTFAGGSGDDQLFGGSGKDDVNGGRGADRLRGGLGDDKVDGGVGADQIHGGGGDDDVISASEGRPDDAVDCGDGRDTLIVARSGRPVQHPSCERVEVR